jgi:hypothetical protein
VVQCLAPRLGAHHHPGTAASRGVVHGAVPVVGEVPQVVDGELDPTGGPGLADQGQLQRLQVFGKDRDDVHAHGSCPPASGLVGIGEQTAGVDGRGRTEFLELLEAVAARDDLAAVLVTHNAAAVRRLADRVVYLDGTVRAWGAPHEVLDREWEPAGAFSGHDHEAPAAARCEDA